MIKPAFKTQTFISAFKTLPLSRRAHILKKLQQETVQEQFQKMFANIDARVKKYPITQEEIDQVVEEVKEELYAQRKNQKGRH